METSHSKARKARAGVALIGLLSVGCMGEMKGGGGPAGEVRLALSLPDGTSVNSVSWKILSATSSVIVSGTLVTSGSQRPSFIASLPPAIGDTVNMTATTSSGAACAGTSSPFNVVAGQSVTVNVNIPCEGTTADGGIGSVVVSGTIVPGDHCPTLTSWLITPQATGVADPIGVTVSAADSDSGDTLSYAWAASAGTFADPSSATTQYHCGPTGTEQLSVQVSDNHTPVPCTTNITFPVVDCL
jgi:hypothetical protein